MSMSNTEKTVKDIRRNTRRKFSTEEITLFACWNCQFWVIMLVSEY